MIKSERNENWKDVVTEETRRGKKELEEKRDIVPRPVKSGARGAG